MPSKLPKPARPDPAIAQRKRRENRPARPNAPTKPVVRKLVNVTKASLHRMAAKKTKPKKAADTSISQRLRRDRKSVVPYASPFTQSQLPQKAKKLLPKARKDKTRKSKPGAKATKSPGKVQKKVSDKKKAKALKQKKEKTEKVRKLGNDKLVPRPEIKEYAKNPFIFGQTPPDYVSLSTLHRSVIRALKNKDMKTFKKLVYDKTFDKELLSHAFSHSVFESAFYAGITTGDKKFTSEFLTELPKVLKIEREVSYPPNLLEQKTTGRKNFHMLGRHTRAIQASRGGREGNNALLNYNLPSERDLNDWDNLNVRLLMSGIDLVTVTKINAISYLGSIDSTDMLTMLRFGDLQAASLLYQVSAPWDFNELHRVTIESGKLPDRILAVSVRKKGHDHSCITPLHTAAINPNAEYLKTFHGIEPNLSLVDTNGWSVVHYAAVSSGAATLKYLISVNSSVTVLDKQARTPLHAAARAGRLHNVKILLDYYDKYEKQSDAERVQTADEEMSPSKKAKAKASADAKSIVNYRDRRGFAALHYAVQWSRHDVVKALLSHPKIDVETATATGDKTRTALMIAAAIGDLQMVKILVEEHKALIEARDKLKRSPILHAVMNGQDHVVAYLLKKGADFLKADSSGNSPAHYAAAYGFLSTLKMLAEVNSECLSAKNDWLLTPLSVAYLKGHLGIVSWMLEGKYSVDINCKDNEGVTLISSLLSNIEERLIHTLPDQLKFLLKHHADCSLTDSSLNNPLHLLASLSVKLNENKKTQAGELSVAQLCECADLIITAGADIIAKNSANATPFQCALERGNLVLAEYLFNLIPDKKAFLESSESNLIAALVQIPAKVRARIETDNRNAMRNTSVPAPIRSPLTKEYDISLLLENLFIHAPEKSTEWLKTPVKNGDDQSSMVTIILVNDFCVAKKSKSDQTPYIDSLCNTMLSIFKSIFKFAPGTLQQTGDFVKPTEKSLIHTAINADDKLLETIIQAAIHQNRLSQLLSVRDGTMRTPLQAAIVTGNKEAVIHLLRASRLNKCSHGVHDAVHQTFVNVEGVETSVRRSILHMLVEKNMLDALDELDLTPDDWLVTDKDDSLVLTNRSEFGDSAYHYACNNLNSSTIAFLKKLKLPDEHRGRLRRTPLHLIVNAEKTYSVDAFLEPIQHVAGLVDVNAVDDFGRTALHYAFIKFNDLTAKRCDPIAVVSYLVGTMTKEGIAQPDRDGNTALHFAALQDANICAVALMNHGCDINIRNTSRNTPLGIAIIKKWPSTALTMIQARADMRQSIYIDKPNKKEENPWDWFPEIEPPAVQQVEDVASLVVKNEWHSVVYVILDLLEKTPETVLQLARAALRNKQHNFSAYLLRMLQIALTEARKSNQDFVFDGASLLKAFVEGLKGDFDNNAKSVLTTLLRIHPTFVSDDGESEMIEVACKAGQWEVVEFLKEDSDGAAQYFKLSTKGRAKALAGLIECFIASKTPSPAVSRGIGLLAMPSVLAYKVAYPNPVLEGLPTTRRPPDLIYITPFERAIQAQCPALILLLLPLLTKPPPNTFILAIRTNNRAVIKAVFEGSLEVVKVPEPTNEVSNTFGNRKRLITCPRRTFLMPMPAKRSRPAPSQSSSGSGGNGDEDDEDDDSDNNSTASSEEEEEEEEIKEVDLTKFTLKVKTNLDINFVDDEGRNVYHYLVTPVAWENVDLLEALFNVDKATGKTLLCTKDKNGDSPQDIAARTHQRKMLKAMTKLVGKTTAVLPDFPPHDVSALMATYNIDEDAHHFLEKFANEQKEKQSQQPLDRTPHKKSDMATSGEIVIDRDTGILFKVLLNKTDIQYGTFGFHNFYRMELIKRKDADLYVLFTHWGRIGDRYGEFQSTPFSDYEKGAKEFKSIFRQKCGQDWCLPDNFNELDNKYRLVKELPKKPLLHKLPIDLHSTEQTDEVYNFIKDISHVESLSSYLKTVSFSNVNFDCPLGAIGTTELEKGREILKTLNELYREKEELMKKQDATENSAKATAERLMAIFDKQRVLSSKFYSFIPIGGYESEILPVLENAQKMNEVAGILNQLSEVEIATRILCAATWRKKECESIRYIQYALECDFTPLSPQTEFSQRLLQYVRASSKATILGVIEVTSKASCQRYNSHLNEENQMYLWHGTRAVNLISILRHGFQKKPANALECGNLYGEGVYFADSFSKSQAYCSASNKGVNYMLLCQIALGSVHKGEKLDFTKPDNFNFDTRFIAGTKGPNSTMSINFDGVTLPCGPIVAQKGDHYFDWSEYVVREEDRTLPRYIVIWK